MLRENRLQTETKESESEIQNKKIANAIKVKNHKPINNWSTVELFLREQWMVSYLLVCQKVFPIPRIDS